MDLKKIIPFEPISSKSIPQGDEWIYETKWDGTRILTYYDGIKVCLYNRKQNERTNHYPELVNIATYCSASSFILDGEVIALNEEGHPSFHNVMKRDAIRKIEKIAILQQKIPIFYCIFDIIYLNGKWVHELPLRERKERLKEVIIPSKTVRLTPHTEDGEALFQAIKERNMEGIVAKNMNSKYEFNQKNESWQKIKNFHDIIAVVGGVAFRGKVVNALLLGLYDNEGNLHYVGHAGTGKLTNDDWHTITSYVSKLSTNTRPFVNEPVRKGEHTWLEPTLTVKIQYIEWEKGHAIRQPSIQAFVDIPPEQCKHPHFS